MKALSIRQPWVHAILHFGKRVENRDWKGAPRFMVGQTFLIHSAKGCTRDELYSAADFMRDVYRLWPWEGATIIPPLDNLPRGALVARAVLADVIMTDERGHRAAARFDKSSRCRGCDALVAASRGNCPRPDPWAIPGAMGLVLADVAPLPAPVPFTGAPGFFDVPDSVIV